MSRAGKTFLKVFVPPILAVGLHSGAVAYRRQSFVEKVDKQKENPLGGEFRVGTADDIVMDTLQTGDILLFKRKWYYHYLPMALNIWLYRYITKSEFDHAAVVVVDKFGKVWVVENTPFKGVQCRNFEDRIAYSESQLITLISLQPKERRNLGSRLITKPSNAIRVLPNEFFQTSTFIYNQGRKRLESFLSPKAEKKDIDEEEDVCPEVKMVQCIYDEIGMTMILPPTDTTSTSSSQDTINVQDILDKKMIVQHASAGKLSYADEHILIRTR